MQAEQLQGPGGETRWRLSDVIGKEEGLGVECLSGSGAIASAYNRAFAEVHFAEHTPLQNTARIFSSMPGRCPQAFCTAFRPAAMGH